MLHKATKLNAASTGHRTRYRCRADWITCDKVYVTRTPNVGKGRSTLDSEDGKVTHSTTISWWKTSIWVSQKNDKKGVYEGSNTGWNSYTRSERCSYTRTPIRTPN